jgi:hypothetical protein
MSKATGTMDLQSGHFHLILTSLDGNGPTGEVTGTKDPNSGAVTAELDGPGCSKLKLGPTNPYVRKADGTDWRLADLIAGRRAHSGLQRKPIDPLDAVQAVEKRQAAPITAKGATITDPRNNS